MLSLMRIPLAGVLLCSAFLAPALFGAQEAELKDSEGKTIIRYVIEVPAGVAAAGTTDPAKQVGLFLCFPEHDRPTGDELLPVRESLRRQGLTDKYILLAGHPQAQKFGPADHEPLGKLIDWAKKNYAINPRRVYMYGKGEGSKISAEFAAMHPAVVTAAIGYSWGWWMMPSELEKPIDFVNSAPEFYMVLGLRDLATHIATVRDTYGRVTAKGYHVIYREFDDLGGRTYHPVSNDDAIAWATRLRNKNIPPSREELRLLQQTEGNGSLEALSLVGGAPAGAVVRRLLGSADARVRAAAAETCSHAIFDEATVAALSASVVDPDARVRRAALGALALNAQWRSAAAQKILTEMATQPAKAVAPADRISAVDGIGQAVRFQVKGVRQDPPLFAALVSLLGDKDEEVRVMAANILAPIRDPDFRGDSGRAEMKTPPGGWPQWLDDITTKQAGFLKEYEVCRGAAPHGTQEPVDLFCLGGEQMNKQPGLAFQNTRLAAEKGYLPAEAELGMMYANGKGVQQDYAEAGKWWTKAGEGGNALAAKYAPRAPKVTPVIPATQP